MTAATSRSSFPERSRSRGFTLLEVLVALAIVAVALGALVAAAGAQSRNTSYLRDKTLAHWVAMNRAVELELQNASAPVPVGRSEGHVDMARREWTWQALVSVTEDPNVHRVEIEVAERDANDSPTARLTAYLYTQQPEQP